MNMITEAMRYFRRAPLVDLDLSHESSPRLDSPGEDGPIASAEQVGAVGHPNDWEAMHEDLAYVRAALEIAMDTLDRIDPTPTELEHKRKGPSIESARPSWSMTSTTTGGTNARREIHWYITGAEAEAN